MAVSIRREASGFFRAAVSIRRGASGVFRTAASIRREASGFFRTAVSIRRGGIRGFPSGWDRLPGLQTGAGCPSPPPLTRRNSPPSLPSIDGACRRIHQDRERFRPQAQRPGAARAVHADLHGLLPAPQKNQSAFGFEFGAWACPAMPPSGLRATQRIAGTPHESA